MSRFHLHHRCSLGQTGLLVAALLVSGLMLAAPGVADAGFIDLGGFTDDPAGAITGSGLSGWASPASTRADEARPAPETPQFVCDLFGVWRRVSDSESPVLGGDLGTTTSAPPSGSTASLAAACLGDSIPRPPALVVWLSHREFLAIPPAPRSGLMRPPKTIRPDAVCVWCA